MGFAACVMVAGGNVSASAQSAVWDTAISNTNWYVPVPQLLAYAAPTTGFSNPIPIGDQTLWSLGASTNGSFTGTSSAQLAIGSNISISNSTIQGFVTTSGQITMVFTPTSGGVTTVGLGQMRTINGVAQMEMQMITGQSLLVTHWAYMLPYNPATFTPPPPAPVPANSVPEWAWTEGTRWRIASSSMFGTATPGRFVVSNYKNGYFWGNGAAPAGSSTWKFHLARLRHARGEGAVQHIVERQSDEPLWRSHGRRVRRTNAHQHLRSRGQSYRRAGLHVPGSALRRGAGGAEQSRRAWCRGGARPDGVNPAGADGSHGADICDPRQSRCTGAFERHQPDACPSSPARRRRRPTPRNARLRRPSSAASTTPTACVPPTLRQSGMSGSSHSAASPARAAMTARRATVRAAAAWSPASMRRCRRKRCLAACFHTRIRTSRAAMTTVPNRLGLDTYQLGLYGAYALRPGTEIDFLLDGGINQNRVNRSLSFVGSTAFADYLSYHRPCRRRGQAADPGATGIFDFAVAAARLRAGACRCI